MYGLAISCFSMVHDDFELNIRTVKLLLGRGIFPN